MWIKKGKFGTYFYEKADLGEAINKSSSEQQPMELESEKVA